MMDSETRCSRTVFTKFPTIAINLNISMGVLARSCSRRNDCYRVFGFENDKTGPAPAMTVLENSAEIHESPRTSAPAAKAPYSSQN